MNNNEHKTILLVEDDLLLAMVEGLTIEKFGYKVIKANTGEKAVELAEISPEIDLILMDINLGAGIDGTQAAREILAKRHIPIVFLTSHMGKEYVDKVKEITRYGYVIKNSTSFVLQSSIEMAFELFEANRDIKIKSQTLDLNKERFSTYFNIAAVMLCSLDVNGSVTSINHKGCEILSLAEGEIIGKNWFDNFLPKNIISEVKGVFQSIISGFIQPVEYYENPILTKNGEEKIISFHNTILKDENNNISGILFSGEDITEKKKVERKLSERFSLYPKTAKSDRSNWFDVPEGLINKWQRIIDIMGRIMDVPASLIMRINDSDITVFLSSRNKGNPYKSGDKEHLKDSGLYCETVISTNKMLLVANALTDEHWMHNPDIKLNMISYLGFPIHLPDGKPFGTICVLDKKDNKYSESHKNLMAVYRDTIETDIELLFISQSLVEKNNQLQIDIAERKKFEEKIQSLLYEKELLLKEVHHRIKNNMATVSGLLMLQAASIKDQSAINALNDAQSRLQSMSVLYNKLYRSDNFSEINLKDYLNNLIDSAFFSSSGGTHIFVEKNLEDITVSAKISFSLGIIINELLTNIIKYAFKGMDKGTVIITASKKGEIVEVVVQDHGVGMPPNISYKNSKGFGLSLVDMMAKQINGTIHIENHNGTKFILDFPEVFQNFV